MFDLTREGRAHADVRLQRHAQPERRRRCTGSTTRTCRPSTLVDRRSGAPLSTSARGSSCRRTTVTVPARRAGRSARRSASTICVVARAGQAAGHRRHRRRAGADFGEATIRSTNAGVSFSAFGNDAQNPRNTQPRGRARGRVPSDEPEHRVRRIGRRRRAQRRHVHEHQRPLRAARSIRCRRSAHGAVARCRRALLPQQADCRRCSSTTSRSIRTRRCTRLMGGLQDNSTIWLDGTAQAGVWKSLFPFGDGTSASGFHPTRSERAVRELPEQPLLHELPQRRARSAGCAPTIRSRSSERASDDHAVDRAAVPDVRPRAARTRSSPASSTSGARRTTAAARRRSRRLCRNLSGVERRGRAATGCRSASRFRSRRARTPDSTSRKPGDLTSDFYGRDRVGGMIVAAERSPADTGTLWAATNFGRLFISKNADAAGQPGRVRADRQRGHARPVRHAHRRGSAQSERRVRLLLGLQRADAHRRPATSFASSTIRRRNARRSRRSTSISAICRSTRSPSTTSAAISTPATDFGPLVLPAGASSWQAAGIGFPEALMVDLKIVPDQRLLVAATHGLGIFYLTLK